MGSKTDEEIQRQRQKGALWERRGGENSGKEKVSLEKQPWP